ncbi:VF530 family DNA-binding protein [Parashewanella tropica]|uniref:VF530 family protein n=1 Tax=Parashewanella tropica TaxID=2547970 RepID=UPI00105A9EC0|nr:VF530 family protein [Parashewanella tropica]
MNQQPNNPLHGIKLESLLVKLHEKYGWSGLAQRVNINCFKSDPSIKSSLKFLRKQQWARDKVEQLYIDTFCGEVKKPKSETPLPGSPWANSRIK